MTETSSRTAAPPSDELPAATEVPFIERPETVRALRYIVIAMGAILVLGLAVVIGRIVYLVSRPSAPATVAVDAVSRPQAAVAGQPGQWGSIDLTLPAGAQIRTLALDGNRLAIHHISPDGSGILILDTATGALLSRVRLLPEVPGNGAR